MLSSINSYKDIEDSNTNIAILASGATEQCGPYLPLGIDTACADFYGAAWAKALGGYFVPTLPFNTSEEHASKIGTITLSPKLMISIFEEIIECLSKQGFRKFVLTGGHGGAYWVSPFIKNANYKYPDMIIINAHSSSEDAWKKGLAAAGLSDCTDVHGGLLSACLAAFLLPIKNTHISAHGELVKDSWKDYWDYCCWDKFVTSGSMGSLSMETSISELYEKGRKLLETFVKYQSEILIKHVKEACRIKGIK